MSLISRRATRATTWPSWSYAPREAERRLADAEPQTNPAKPLTARRNHPRIATEDVVGNAMRYCTRPPSKEQKACPKTQTCHARSPASPGSSWRERLSPVEVVMTLLGAHRGGQDELLHHRYGGAGARGGVAGGAGDHGRTLQGAAARGARRPQGHHLYQGRPHHHGLRLLPGHVPDHSATVARKLEEAGSVLIGKTNTHEFAYGPTGDRSYFGPTRNPHDTRRITGGSSSGSGAAVAADLCYGALGSDTGGSIRIPAALCGIVGMKPTFGRVSKSGVFPLSWTLDHVGPITRTVEDNALMLNVLAGHDPEDPYSVDRPAEDFTRDLRRGVRGAVIGVPRSFYFEHVDGGGGGAGERGRGGLPVARRGDAGGRDPQPLGDAPRAAVRSSPPRPTPCTRSA